MTLADEANLFDVAKGGDGAKSAPSASPAGTEIGAANPWEKLRTVGTPDQWRDAGPKDNVAGVQPTIVFEPTNEVELAMVLRYADSAGLSVIPRGSGSKLGWGNPPIRADLVLSTVRLNRVIEHAWADLTVSVEAGCTIATLQDTLAQHGQRVAIDPLWPEHTTIGGLLSTNDSGTLRIRYGGLRDLIIGVTIALSDGTLASSGGKVVKNVAGYDLPKLVTGALGTLGVVTRAVFRLHPLPHNVRSFTFVTRDAADANRFVLAVQDSKLAHTGLQVRFNSGAQPEVDIRFDGTDAGLAAQTETLQKLATPAGESQSNEDVWHARQHLFGTAPFPPSLRYGVTSARPTASTPGDTTTPAQDSKSTAIAKFSVLPASIASTCEQLRGSTEPLNVHWSAVVQGTGLGWIRLGPANANDIRQLLQTLRSKLEPAGGSLVVQYRSSEIPEVEAWGNPGDALPLMLSVKQQFDARKTLNPGRFVGGI
ncbi:MAG: FAD-binding oxidoreductase [Verrucomicrobia bacterium]|nr:FAD-binding oxidoreductase [Verrucomicrobiota bacterium]